MASGELVTEKRAVLEGKLFKKGKFNTAWKERYFVLYSNRVLAWFENATDAHSEGRSPAKNQEDLSHVQSINLVPTKEEHKLEQSKRKRQSVTTPDSLSATSSDESRKIGKISVSITADMAAAEAAVGTPVGSSSSISSSPYSEEFKRQTQCVDKSHAFEIVTARRVYVLAAETATELAQWRLHLERVVFGSRVYATEGWKRGAMRKTWKKRWFVLYDTGEMRYYDNSAMKQMRGVIRLRGQVLLMCPGDADQYTQQYTIQILTHERNWVLAAEGEEEREHWISKLEEVIHGAKKLITAHEGYMWKRSTRDRQWKKRYFALSKGFLFYFDSEFHCHKFASIIFFSESFFNQAFRLYVKGNIALQHTTVHRVGEDSSERASLSASVSGAPAAPMRPHCFVIRTERKQKFFFACDSVDELREWFQKFRQAQKSGFGSRVADDVGSSGSITSKSALARAPIAVISSLSSSSSSPGVTSSSKVDATDKTVMMDGDDEKDVRASSVDLENEIKSDEASLSASLRSNEADALGGAVPFVESDDGSGDKDRSDIAGRKGSQILHFLQPSEDGTWVDVEDPEILKKQTKILRGT